MGNESSLVKDCRLEKEVPLPGPEVWRLYQSRHRDGSRVSVFVYETDHQHTAYIENAAKYLKVLRHPSILKFDGIEKVSDGVWLATEQVSPLGIVLEDLSSAEVVAGLHNILEGLVFLHEKGGLCHNNLCMSSVFVSQEGTWKLGGMEYLCRFDQATTPYLAKRKSLRNAKALAPEEKTGPVESGTPGWARDVFAFGILADILLEYLSDLGDLTKTFELRIQDECLNLDPYKRPKLSCLLQDRLFKNNFLQIINFLRNVTLKTVEEKRDFFCDLVERVYELPVDVCATRLVRPLLSRFVLLDATACQCLLPHLLTPYTGDQRPQYDRTAVNPLLPEKLFRKHVIPEVYKIFHVRDVHVRMVLLEHMDCYLDQFDRETLQNHILPQILLGVRDTNDDLVQASLHAAALLVPVLGGDVVVGTNRLRIFSEATPKFSSSLPGTSEGKSPMEPNGIISTNTNVSSPSKKPTLKELAGDVDSSQAPEDQTEYQRRQEERERRQEETRRRNEERRKRRLEREKQLSLATKTTEDTLQSTSEISPSHEYANEADSDWSKKNSSLSPQHSKVLEPTDSDYEREIEEELNTIDPMTTMGPQKSGDVSTRHPPPIFPTTSKGALKLPSKIRTSPPPVSKNTPTHSDLPPSIEADDSAVKDISYDDTEKWAEGGEDNAWNSQDWDDINQSASPELVINSLVTKNSERVAKLTAQKQQKNLQPASVSHKVADLNIMSLDIKTSSSAGQEFDFFEDMKPQIKSSEGGLWGMLNTSSKSTSKELTVATNTDANQKSLSFAMANASNDQTEDGWGEDDLDWGQEDS